MRRMAQAVIDEFDELRRADRAASRAGPRAEIATLELLAAIDALIWIADEGARVLGGRRVGVTARCSRSSGRGSRTSPTAWSA